MRKSLVLGAVLALGLSGMAFAGSSPFGQSNSVIYGGYNDPCAQAAAQGFAYEQAKGSNWVPPQPKSYYFTPFDTQLTLFSNASPTLVFGGYRCAQVAQETLDEEVTPGFGGFGYSVPTQMSNDQYGFYFLTAFSKNAPLVVRNNSGWNYGLGNYSRGAVVMMYKDTKGNPVVDVFGYPRGYDAMSEHDNYSSYRPFSGIATVVYNDTLYTNNEQVLKEAKSEPCVGTEGIACVSPTFDNAILVSTQKLVQLAKAGQVFSSTYDNCMYFGTCG
ncbi:hypothetical protein ACSSZE_15470 [Acidithiobacillus caldus]